MSGSRGPRIAVLGAGGLIGHKLFQILQKRFDHVTAVLHGSRSRFSAIDLFEGDNTIDQIDVLDFDKLTDLLQANKIDVVLNCVGITKRRPEINDPMMAIAVNALFPHKLAAWAKVKGKRVIHFSTDCVFDGTDGPYTEESLTTAKDAYGRTKALGEIDYGHTLTLRSSFIGRELNVHSELLDWFLAREGETIKGFKNAWYSGISTIEMARIVGDIIEHHPDLAGLHQLSTKEPISKYDLLICARDAFGANVEIEPFDNEPILPVLNSSKLRRSIDPAIPSWPDMMAGLAADQALYAHIDLKAGA